MFERGLGSTRRGHRLPGAAIGVKGLFLLAGLGWMGVAVAAPVQLAVEIEGAKGGRVDGLPDGSQCAAACVAVAPEPSLVSLLAEPESGFRFANWQGACETTLGPLCTLPLSTDASVGVRFVPETEPEPAQEAVLLLHDAGEMPAVWNRAVDRQFNGRCPMIYGGVLLGGSAQIAPEAPQCYRLRFGYYAALDPAANPDQSVALWAVEIRAAVAGLMDAHPRLRLVLVGKGEGLTAAQDFLAAPSPEQASVAGLLAIGPPPQPVESPSASPAPSAVSESQIAAQALELLRSH